MTFNPKFTITPGITRLLLEIERHREAIDVLPVSAGMIASLRETARLLSTHYSTQIEGNELSASEVRKLAEGHKGGFPGRERDEREVRNYFRALAFIEPHFLKTGPIKEQLIRQTHSLVLTGAQRGTPYREGQNVIRDSQTGGLVYMPPEAMDVPVLMSELVDWINAQMESHELPAPLVAGIVHYQFATIHPYYDGNGRTARLLTTLVLHRMGYGLKGIYSLEEYYAKNLAGYYQALDTGTNHNYYEGRGGTEDITPFLEYFLSGMARSFGSVRKQAEKGRDHPDTDQSELLRELRPVQRQLLSLFGKSKEVSLQEMALHLGIDKQPAHRKVREWLDEGFIQILNPSKKARTYGLTEKWEQVLREGSLLEDLRTARRQARDADRER